MRERLLIVALLVALLAAAAVTVIVASSNTNTADEALRKAEVNQMLIHRHAVDDRLKTEQICSKSHPEFCQQLWDRLLRYTTKKQGLQAACDLLAQLHRQGLVNRLRRRSGCPPPTPAYRPRR